MQVEAQDVLEIGESVVAAEPHVVAEERQHQSVGERLRDDRKVHAGDARPECKPPEHERQQAWHQRHHDEREREVVEAVPEPGQRLVVQKHHEVGQHGIAVHAPGADLPHQIHAHGVAAQREESRVAQAQDAAVSPDQVERQRQHPVAQVLADQRDPEGREMKRGRSGHSLVEDWHRDSHHGEHRQKPCSAPIRPPDPPPRSTRVVRFQRPGTGLLVAHSSACLSHYLSSAARPFCGNSPRGRALNEKNQRDQDENLCQHRSGVGLKQLVDDPIDMPPMSDPHRFPTPPKTTTMNESMM